MKKSKLKEIIEELKQKSFYDNKEKKELESENFHKDLKVCTEILSKYATTQLDVNFEDVGFGIILKKYTISFERF